MQKIQRLQRIVYCTVALLFLAIAMVTTRLLLGLLYDVHPLDLTALLTAGLLVVSTTALASYLPARRAMRVDPVAMLRAIECSAWPRGVIANELLSSCDVVFVDPDGSVRVVARALEQGQPSPRLNSRSALVAMPGKPSELNS
jgi:hypothetical protein